MPLRAILDNQDVIAPTLSSGEWQALRQETRAGIHTLRLPCCSSHAFQRTSPRGLQHFYHPPGLPCEERGETLDHLDAKLAIVRACERVGYQAWPEASGDGWRADVLCVRGSVRIAFEIQWSRQTLRETLARQRRYAEQGIRGCWFFRLPPLGAKRSNGTLELEGRRDLPLFHLVNEPESAARVYLNGRHEPLDDLVTALLTGQIRFRSTVTIARWQWVRLRFYEVPCERCGTISHACSLDPPAYASYCGVSIPLHRGRFDTSRAAARKEVQRAIWIFMQSDAGLHLRVADIKPRSSDPSQRGLSWFGCFHCDAPFAEYTLWKLEDAAHRSNAWAASHTTLVAMPGPVTVARPHWCHPDDGMYC